MARADALTALAQDIAAADPGSFWLWTLLFLAGSVAAFAGAFLSLRKARLIEDTPTSRIRSAAQGYVELEGFAQLLPGPEVISPLSGARCVWWKYSIERRETVYRNGKRTTEWRTIESGTSEHLFLLADATGDCVVDPGGATVYPSLTRTWQGRTRRPQRAPEKPGWLQFGDYRYRERLLRVGDPVHAMGWFRSDGVAHSYDESSELRDLLREWKADHASLLQRFDADGNGEIDLQEWEAARRAALEQIRQQHVERSLTPDVHVLSRPRDRRPFLLSSLPQEKLVRRYRWSGLSLLMASLATGTGGVFALVARGWL
ncbi:MAG TPA: GIDE domain-containing protein [Solimonas sp.]